VAAVWSSAAGRRLVLLDLAAAMGPFCHYCGMIPANLWLLTVDHIVPVSIGGRSTRTNYVLACQRCNWALGAAEVKCDCRRCRRAGRLSRAWRAAHEQHPALGLA
jgi:hypothetical protein